MQVKNPHYGAGITLLELMIVIAIIGIAATIATPSLQNLLRNNQVASQNNELVALVTFAKSQAIRNNEIWQVDLYLDGNGWAGYVLPANRAPNDVEEAGCPEESGVVRCSRLQGLNLTSTETRVQFNNRGFLVNASAWGGSGSDNPPGLSLRLEHPQCSPGQRQARTIEILPTGQIVSQPAECANG